MTIVARRLTQEQDGIPGYAAHPEGTAARLGVLMAHHAHGITGDCKIDAYRLASGGWSSGMPSRTPTMAFATPTPRVTSLTTPTCSGRS